MCYPGVVHKPMTVRDELTRSRRAAPNERVLFGTHLCFKKKKKKKRGKRKRKEKSVKNEPGIRPSPPSLTPSPPPPHLHLHCAIPEVSHWFSIRELNTHTHTHTERERGGVCVCYLSTVYETNCSIQVWHQLIGVNWSIEVTDTCPDRKIQTPDCSSWYRSSINDPVFFMLAVQ